MGPLKLLDLRMSPILELDFKKQRLELNKNHEKVIEIAKEMKDEEISAKLREEQIKRKEAHARQWAKMIEIDPPKKPGEIGYRSAVEVAVVSEAERESEENVESEQVTQMESTGGTEGLRRRRKKRDSASVRREMIFEGGVGVIDTSDLSSEDEDEDFQPMEIEGEGDRGSEKQMEMEVVELDVDVRNGDEDASCWSGENVRHARCSQSSWMV